MDLMNYIMPKELPLQFIIYLIIGVAIIVLVKCLQLVKKARNNIILLSSNNDAGLCNVDYLKASLELNDIDTNFFFDKYVEDKNRNSDTEPLFEHLRAIYEAGSKSSRLDSDLLVRNTVDKIFAGTDTIKSLISLFLVLGILGTLLGLAISIGSFSGEGFVLNAEANKTASELSKLFGNLRGAFAPSMWGVTATIVFVFLYTVLVQEACINKLTEQLTTVTINKWLPALYPTDFQKGEISMVKLNNAVQTANESLANHNSFVNKTHEMFGNLVETNETIKELKNVSTVLKESSVSYLAGSEKLAEMKEILTEVSEKLQSDNEWFKTYVNAQITSIKTVQDSCLQVNEEVHKCLELSTEKNIKATNGLQNMQNEILEAVGKPLQEQLDSMAVKLSGDLEGIAHSVNGVSTAVNRISNPLESSAEQIQQMFRRAVDEIDKKNQLLAKEGGLSEAKIAEFKTLMSNNSVQVDNTAVEAKLDKIVTCLETLKIQSNNGEQRSSNKLLSYMPAVIAVLLALSIGVQGLIVNKLTILEQTQSEVNNIILKGEKVN